MKAVALLVAFFSLSLAAQQDPIRLDPKNPHYFQYNNKTIALITSGEHYGSVINPDFNFHKYLDTLQADGLLARCIQHEADHLNGILFIDRMDKGVRGPLDEAIRALAKETRDAAKK